MQAKRTNLSSFNGHVLDLEKIPATGVRVAFGADGKVAFRNVKGRLHVIGSEYTGGMIVKGDNATVAGTQIGFDENGKMYYPSATWPLVELDSILLQN